MKRNEINVPPSIHKHLLFLPLGATPMGALHSLSPSLSPSDHRGQRKKIAIERQSTGKK